MTISRINVNNTEYEIKDEYARNNLGVSEDNVKEIVNQYATENRDILKGDRGEDGKDGSNGADGKSPVKGVDYWTNTDKEEILSECKSYIDSEILGGES